MLPLSSPDHASLHAPRQAQRAKASGAAPVPDTADLKAFLELARSKTRVRPTPFTAVSSRSRPPAAAVHTRARHRGPVGALVVWGGWLISGSADGEVRLPRFPKIPGSRAGSRPQSGASSGMRSVTVGGDEGGREEEERRRT